MKGGGQRARRRKKKKLWQSNGALVTGNREVVCGSRINVATDWCPAFCQVCLHDNDRRNGWEWKQGHKGWLSRGLTGTLGLLSLYTRHKTATQICTSTQLYFWPAVFQTVSDWFLCLSLSRSFSWLQLCKHFTQVEGMNTTNCNFALYSCLKIKSQI